MLFNTEVTVLMRIQYDTDVQPVDPLELWDTPPFEPTVDRKKGMLFHGRGVSDDKGGLLQPIHVWRLIPAQSLISSALHLHACFAGVQTHSAACCGKPKQAHAEVIFNSS